MSANTTDDNLLIAAALTAILNKEVQFSTEATPAVLLRDIATSLAEVCNFPKDDEDVQDGSEVSCVRSPSTRQLIT